MRSILLVACLCSARAWADACFEPPAACALADGKALLGSDPDRAAKRLKASYDLEPKLATLGLYALALQRAKDFVHAATAWRHVKAQAEAALTDATDRRRAVEGTSDVAKIARANDELAHAQERLDSAVHALGEVEGEVGRVRLQFASEPVGLVVSRDGEGDAEITKTYEVFVKAGHDQLRLRFADGHTIVVETTVAAGKLETLPVASSVPVADRVASPPEPPVEPSSELVDDEPPLWTTRREVALGVAGAGVVLVAGAVIAGAVGRSDYDASKAHCDATAACDATGVSQVNNANAAAHLSIGFAIGGAVALGAGAALWFTHRPQARPHVAVVPVVTRDGVGLAIGGSL